MWSLLGDTHTHRTERDRRRVKEKPGGKCPPVSRGAGTTGYTVKETVREPILFFSLAITPVFH